MQQMAKEKILVVDGESGILELVSNNLPKDVYQVKGVLACEKALSEAIHNPPDLILVDLMPQGQSGLSTCRELKSNRKTDHIPIIIFTAKEKDSDIVTGLELGVDGYLNRPVSGRILKAMVRAVLRKKSQQADDEGGVVNRDGLMIDPLNHTAILHGAALSLTATEFALLHFLAQRPGNVSSRNQITRSVKGRNYPDTDRSIDVQIRALRRKLGDSGRLIETVRGIGYRFRAYQEQ
jgi:two-component system, OmpR family, alkaline phosphatase synthesis response regulator PhoP